MDFEIKYKVHSSLVEKLEVVAEDEDNWYVVPPSVVARISKKSALYDDKDVAQYQLFVTRRRRGVPLKNFKSSKYFKEYIERAKKENPELLL
jgi:tRNA isopentenyl-2-thiomethyl-A-37 hydroxylase MiaE